MALSQPKVVVTLDAEPLPLSVVKRVTVAYPDGEHGGTVTVDFAKDYLTQAWPAFTVNSHLVVRMGYHGRAGCPVVFDSSKVAATHLSLEGDKGAPADKLVATWRSRLNDRQTLAPSVEREVYRSNRRGLHGLMRFVAAKVGYTSVRTNIPNVTLPRETVFTPQNGYYKTLMGMLGPMAPLVFADDVNDILYVYWLDSAIPGSPATVGVRKLQSASIDKDTRAIVNQAILRYIPQGRDGGAGGNFDCGGSATHSDDTGRLLFTTLDSCAGDVNLADRTPSELESTRETVFESDDEDGEHVITKTRYWVFSDDREVKYQLETTTFAKGESGPQEKVAFTRTDYLFLGGTNFEVPSGTRTRSEGMVSMPGVGRVYREDVKRTSTQIVSGQFSNEPGVWQELYSVTRERGLLLFPDRVAVELATRNDAVDDSAGTFQYVVPNSRLRKVTRAMTEIGASHLGYQTVEVDYTKEPPRIKTGEDEESLGRQPTRDDGPREVEELIQDLDSIALNGAREAVVIDGTWIGSDTESVDGPGADTITGRDFCLHMARALFRRSGKREVNQPFNSTKLYTRLGRGSVVRLTQRGGAHPHNYLLTGCTYKADPVKGGGFVVSTAGSTRRLEAGEVE